MNKTAHRRMPTGGSLESQMMRISWMNVDIYDSPRKRASSTLNIAEDYTARKHRPRRR
jgi:hypothetical protein